ncbi:MAG: hypothetical protein EXR79_07725 [Myxococcales bacterium]|nr:hypothetical protein [Myxococcales bacterium]
MNAVSAAACKGMERKTSVRQRLAWWLCCLGLAACGAPLRVFDPGVDPGRLEADARAQWTTPATRAAGAHALAWSCLLYGRACGELRARGAEATGEDLAAGTLLRALAAAGTADVGARASAWFDAVLVGLGVPGAPAPAEALATAAALQLERLAVRDRAAVDRALAARAELAPQVWTAGSAEGRWRRCLALPAACGLWAAATAGQSVALPNTVGLPLTVTQRLDRVRARMHIGVAEWQAADFDGVFGDAAGLVDLDDACAAPEFRAGCVRDGRFGLAVERPGLYAVRVTFETSQPGSVWLHLAAPRGVRAWLDGVLWAPPSCGTLPLSPRCDGQGDLAGGTHTLHLLVPTAADGDVLEVAIVPGPAAESLPPTWPGVLRDVVAAFGASRAQVPVGRGILRALVEIERSASLDSAGKAEFDDLDRVLDALPDHVDARIDRAARVRDAGNPELARDMLGPLRGDPFSWPAASSGSRRAVDSADPGGGERQIGAPAAPPVGLARRADLWVERAEQLAALGVTDAATRAFEAAVVAQPGDCAVWRRALEHATDTLQRAAVRRLLASAAPACNVTSSLVRRAHLLSGVETTPAATTTGGVGAASLSVTNCRIWAAAQAEADAPRDPPAGSACERLLARSPAWATQRQWLTAQAGAFDGDGARLAASLREILVGPGHSLDMRQRALEAGATAPWAEFARDGQALARIPDDPTQVAGATTAWVLDQEVDVLLPGGGAIRRVHQVLRVLDDTAAETVGEVRVADGGVLEFARTLLPDGTVVWPAETADKETVSLRAVAAGTSIEFAQVVYVAPDDPATGATRLGPFLFAASDGPIRLSEYVVLAPHDVTPAFEASPTAPAPEVRELGGWRAWVFRREDAPRYRVEPRAVRPERTQASVRVALSPGWPAVMEPWADSLLAGVGVRHPEFDRLVALAKQTPPGAARWGAVAGEVARLVEQQHDGGAPGRPESALGNQKGDRAALLWALARHTDTDGCLVRVAPLSRLPTAAPPDPDDWSISLVRLQIPSTATPGQFDDLWIDPGLEGGLVNHVRAGLRGRQGLLIGCAAAAQSPLVTVPALGAGRDPRRVTVTLRWHADGAIDGEARDELRGALAALVRSWLRGATDQGRRQLLQELAGASFPGLDVAFVAIDELGQADGAIAVRYRITAPAAASRVDALDLALYPDALGPAYCALADRKTPLLFAHTLDTRVEVRITSLGRPPHTRAAPAAHAAGPLRHTCTATTEGATARFEKTIAAEPTVVAPADYPAFAAALRGVDAADAVRIER